MRFICSLVRVPSVDSKFLDSGSCSCSCLGPSAGLQAGSAKGCGREPSPQGDSDHRRHFGSWRPAPPLNPEVALRRRPAEHRGAEPASTQNLLAAQEPPSDKRLPVSRVGGGKAEKVSPVAEDPAHAQLASRVSKVTFPKGGGVRELIIF